MTSYREALKNIQSKLDKNLFIEDRIQLVNKLFSNNDYVEAIFEYISSPIFRNQNGKKKKADPLYENTYLAIGLSNVAEYPLNKWSDWEEGNAVLNDYTIMSKYDIDRLAKPGKNKQIVGLDMSVADDFLENGVSKTVLQGWEFHVDQLERNTTRANDIFKFSEDDKREARNKEVIKNLEKYPTLLERYTMWQEIGLLYGFSNVLNKEQKEDCKKKWIEHFKNENNPIRPRDRYYRLLRMYNNIGYELSKILDELRNPIKPRLNKQLNGNQSIQDNSAEFILRLMNFGIQEHVKGLLTIQKGKTVGEYFPLYHMLKEKYKGDDESAFSVIADELGELLQIADLTDMERDIVNLITGSNNEYDIHSVDGNINPYELIALYINEKYEIHKTKSDIKHLVDGKISKTISDTHNDLKNGIDTKKCTRCKVSKLASKNNFGADTRKSEGLKSICRKCAAEKEKKRRGIV